VIKLTPIEHLDGETEPIIMPARMPGLILRQAADGWHGLWESNGVTHQIWLAVTAPDAAAVYESVLPWDRFYKLRLHAARRLRRSFDGLRPGPEYRKMPAQLRQWHILSLRALDARLHGESYRTIAEILLGFRGTKEDFENDSCKNKARRLVDHGVRMMLGDYRLLLHYPIKRARR
jgi:hypothetical protein